MVALRGDAMRKQLFLFCVAIGLVLASSAPAAQAPALTVTLLGTGDPTPRIDRFGPATLVRAGGHALLFDAGRGVLQRLRQSGVSSGELDGIFLTHLHSDHVVGLVDLWLGGWVVDGREAPLVVYGPPGTRAMMANLRQAFDYDIGVRIAEAGRSPAGIEVRVVEIEPGEVWARDGVTVRAFEVDHRPVEPAYGFRIDHGGHAVALSGDTRPSKSLERNAAGVDLLVHEVAEAPEAFKAAHPHLPRLQHHTQAKEAGRVFAVVRPKLAVFTHLVLVDGFPADGLAALAHQTYDGDVMVGEDLMSFDVGDTVQVRRPGAR
jgi:ribonuclease Z